MRRSERGATVVLMALAMVALLTFAAMAVDYGSVTNERRRAQTAADAGSLAGGAQLLAGHARSDAVEEVIAISYDNLEPELSPAEWRDRWASDCTDPDRPAGYTASAFTPCISFNQFNTRVRVKLPRLHVDATFAQVIGIEALATTAFAEAELVPTGFGRVLPFGVPGSSGDQTELCLKSASGPHSELPCTGPVTGNFGSLDISLFGNPALGTPEICGNADPNGKLKANMILGSDHPLDEWNESPADPLDPAGAVPEGVRDDHELCPDLGARPNALWGQTGVGSNLDAGMVEGMTLDGRPLSGRLTLGTQIKREVRSGSLPLDDRPLWDYISPTATVPDIPPTCEKSAFGPTSTKADMTECITDYLAAGSTAELFTAGILETPRFGFVPLFHESTFVTGTSSRYLIRKFLPIFLQTTRFQCGTHGCEGIFDPGERHGIPPVAHNKKVDEVTALLLPETMLPASAVPNAAGGSVTKDLALRR